jgi:hypothetical protein
LRLRRRQRDGAADITYFTYERTPNDLILPP